MSRPRTVCARHRHNCANSAPSFSTTHSSQQKTRGVHWACKRLARDSHGCHAHALRKRCHTPHGIPSLTQRVFAYAPRRGGNAECTRAIRRRRGSGKSLVGRPPPAPSHTAVTVYREPQQGSERCRTHRRPPGPRKGRTNSRFSRYARSHANTRVPSLGKKKLIIKK